MSALVVVLLLAVMLSVVSVGLAAWCAARMLRRLRRFTGQLVDRGALSVRARLHPGAAGQVAGARLQLRSGIDQTRRIVDDAVRRNDPLGELPRLFRRIEHLAESVDAELRMLDGDPDRIQQARLAATVRHSAELASMAAAVRRTVSGVHADMQLDRFGLLQRDLDVELAALRAGAAAARRMGAVTPRL